MIKEGDALGGRRAHSQEVEEGVQSGSRRLPMGDKGERNTMNISNQETERDPVLALVEAHMLRPGHFKVVPKADLSKIPRECSDGRNDHEIFGEFGGDFAAKLRMVRAAEKAMSKTFSDEEVAGYMGELIKKSGGTYFHVDTHFVEAVADAYYGESGEDHVRQMIQLFSQPSPEDRKKILDILADIRPSKMGCGHLGLMKQDPEAFDLRKGYMLAAYRSMFNLMWDGSADVTMHLMSGKHREQAIVLVNSVIPDHFVAVRPQIGDEQVFIATPDATAELQKQSFGLALEVFGGELPEDRYLEELDGLLKVQNNATLQKLGAAQGKPVYTAEFSEKDGETSVKVTKIGVNGAIAA